ncbi:MAG: hypothetical protein SW833_02085 [Cyanobacteriota bacterium]|nr:hypothetical protein [Cyanobacteriota bacterium]
MKKLKSIRLFLAVFSLLVLSTAPFEAVQANRDETEPPVPATFTGQTQRIQFEPGTTSAVVEHSVIRGMRDTYTFRAQAGQAMIIDVISLEGNAVFDLVAPNGDIVLAESSAWSGFLPGEDAGDYKIIVGGTRGNATYTLNVEIL